MSANRNQVIKALQDIGASVTDTSCVGGGFPELAVGFRGRNWLIALKPLKGSGVTELFVQRWRGHWACVTSADEAVRLVSRVVEVES